MKAILGGVAAAALLPVAAGLALVAVLTGGVGTSTVCPASTVAYVAAAAGFSGEDQPIAVAVAQAESGGDPNATHLNGNGTTDFGLWQINSVHVALLAMGDWRDPAANARMAYAVWQQSGWRAWSTYKSGTYRKYLDGCAVTLPAVGLVGQFLAVATAQVGSPYVWGGTSLSSPPGAGNGRLDCSGLIYASWAQVLGHALPVRTADQMYHGSVPVANGQEQPGDLGFSEFTSLGGEAVHVAHVWIVVRPGLAMEASYPGRDLAERSYDALSEGVIFGRLPAAMVGV